MKKHIYITPRTYCMAVETTAMIAMSLRSGGDDSGPAQAESRGQLFGRDGEDW